MSMRRFFSINRNSKADRSSLENERPPPPYTSNVTSVPTHNLSGRDSVRQPDETESSHTDTPGVAETPGLATQSPNYSKHPSDKFMFSHHFSYVWILLVYYRIYAEDGAIPSKTPVTPGDPFLGRIKARSVPPPRTAKALKCSIAKVENIKDRESTTLFLTPYSQSPMDDADKFTVLNGTGPGSTPQEPLALVAKMSDADRRTLGSGRRGGLASTTAPDTTLPETTGRYGTSLRHSPTFLFVRVTRLLWEVYYLLYADDYEILSKVGVDPEEPSLGRIWADSIAPPHTPTSIKRCISRVEKTPALAHANLFADTLCDTPLTEGHISILCTGGPGLSPSEPMAVVQVGRQLIVDGKYVIKNRAADIYWSANNPLTTVYFWACTLEYAKGNSHMQVNEQFPIIQVFRR